MKTCLSIWQDAEYIASANIPQGFVKAGVRVELVSSLGPF